MECKCARKPAPGDASRRDQNRAAGKSSWRLCSGGTLPPTRRKTCECDKEGEERDRDSVHNPTTGSETAYAFVHSHTFRNCRADRDSRVLCRIPSGRVIAFAAISPSCRGCCGRLDSGIEWRSGEGNTTMPPLMQLSLFFAAMAVFVATGCILTRKPKEKLPTLPTTVPDERRPGCFPHEE